MDEDSHAMHRPLLPLLLMLSLVASGCLGANPDAGTAGGPVGDDDRDAGTAPTSPSFAASPEEAPLRPGASLGGYCTFNWVFTAPNGTAYIGTAAHCTQVGERVTLGSDGPEVGTVVYDSDNASVADAAVDFSLVRLDAEIVNRTHPTIIGWSGPTGWITDEDAARGDDVALSGYGVGFGERGETRNRSGVLVSMDDRFYSADMPAVNGDSGSPLIHLETGKALGIISHYGFGATPPTTDEGPVMEFILRELTKAGWDVELTMGATS